MIIGKMPGCAAIGCNNRSEKGYTMKCFPRDPVLRKIWKKRVGRADWEPSNNSFLCHVHFEPSQWVSTSSGKLKLKKGALPSIFTVTSTRKSPKKRQKRGAQTMEEEETDFEEYQVEYLENDCPFIFNMVNQKSVPNIISIQTQNDVQTDGQILQNVSFISSEALKDLQNENIIIVADENNREIGKIINENGFVLVENERGKENVQILPKTSANDIKVEVKEETPENGLTSNDYDEIERKLKEICDYENETESPSNSQSSPKPKQMDDQLVENECLGLADGDHESSIKKENVNHKSESSKVNVVRTGIKRKRGGKSECFEQEAAIRTSQSIKNGIQFSEDAANIINDLETENSEESISQQGKYVASIVSIKDGQTNGNSKTVIKNDIQLRFKNDVNKPVQSKKNNVTYASNIMPSDKLSAKLSVQGEVIEKLTNQLIMYKDMERKMQNLIHELENKEKEIELLKSHKLAAKKSQSERKPPKVETADLKDASETDLRNRIDFLEDNNKKLMKTVTLEGQNRRKLECQVKSRNNQIKELNWKLEKASKFLDRAEKNANNYRKKMLNMQALMRRNKLMNKKSGIFDELLVGQSNQSFSKNAFEKALEIEKVCGIEGYQKLLSCDFPLPSLSDLSKTYPAEVEYYEADDLISLENNESINATDNSMVDGKMENVEYLDPEFLSNECGETVTGTVQDIFNECSDSEELNLNELKEHILINLDAAT